MRALAELKEEVSEAMDTLRCPTCLSIVADGSVKRCPACGSRFRARRGPVVLGEDTESLERPLLLVEQELKARIEARTAPRYRQRRRAAKAARRIASLPPSLLEGEVAGDGAADAFVRPPDPVAHEYAPPEPGPQDSGPGETLLVVDLPESAIHEPAAHEEIVDTTPAEPEPEPEPVVRVAPPEPEAVVAEVVEPKVVEPEEPEPEPEVAEPEVVVPEVLDPVVEPEPEVVIPATEQVIDLVAESEREESPAPKAPRSPRVAVSWERESTLWVESVFSHGQGARKPETVTFPRPRQNDDSSNDLASESS